MESEILKFVGVKCTSWGWAIWMKWGDNRCHYWHLITLAWGWLLWELNVVQRWSLYLSVFYWVHQVRVVRVDYWVEKPAAGVHFHGTILHTHNQLRRARCWFPCVDSTLQRSRYGCLPQLPHSLRISKEIKYIVLSNDGVLVHYIEWNCGYSKEQKEASTIPDTWFWQLWSGVYCRCRVCCCQQWQAASSGDHFVSVLWGYIVLFSMCRQELQ
jgi:hypothetical protein